MHADFISSGGLSSVSVSCIRLAYHPFAPASFHFHLPGGRLSVISHLCSLLDGGWTSFSRPLPALSPLPFPSLFIPFLFSPRRARDNEGLCGLSFLPSFVLPPFLLLAFTPSLRPSRSLRASRAATRREPHERARARRASLLVSLQRKTPKVKPDPTERGYIFQPNVSVLSSGGCDLVEVI